MRGMATLVAAAVLLGGTAAGAHAQGIRITPAAGAYFQGGSFQELRGEADSVRVKREATLGLGVSVEAGALRASLAYASGATLKDKGISNAGDVGTGSVLALAGDFVLRPLPKLVVVQPYVLVGAGLKRQDYSWERDKVSDALPDDKSDFSFHAGGGLEIGIGPVGLRAEVTDFISKKPDGGYGQQDAFALLGLSVGL